MIIDDFNIQHDNIRLNKQDDNIHLINKMIIYT